MAARDWWIYDAREGCKILDWYATPESAAMRLRKHLKVTYGAVLCGDLARHRIRNLRTGEVCDCHGKPMEANDGNG